MARFFRRSLVDDFTSPYSTLEALGYDAVVAPTVLEHFRRLGPGTLGAMIAAIPQGARLLDVGCGGGQVALELAEQRPDLQITGVDLNAGQVTRARRRAARRGLQARVSFTEGDALQLPLPDGAFDAVVSVASIKHWPDQVAGLRECLRVLAPGAELMVVEADRGARLEDARRFVASWRGILPGFGRLALMFFYTYVVGQAIDLERARELCTGLDLAEATVERVPGMPALLLRGRKPE